MQNSISVILFGKICIFQVEAGDIILKVNGTDVHRYTTKEVLKCLRLSNDSITLELKRGIFNI